MIRLIKLEWLKLRKYKVFWILVGMYYLGLIIVCSSGMLLMAFFKGQGAQFGGIDPTIIPLYDFPDIWQNMTYVATFFKVILGFIVIISVTNEISYSTLRQNIIEGLGKYEFLASKLSLVFILSITAALFIFVEGLTMGFIYSHVKEAKFIFREMEFLAAYFLEVFTFLCLSLLIGLLVKRAGFAIVLLFMYTLIFEPFVTINFENIPQLPGVFKAISPYLPIRALNNLIKVPFQRYVFMEIQDYVAWSAIAIVSGWLVIYNTLILLILKKRDL